MKTIRVNASKSYDVIIGSGLLDKCAQTCKNVGIDGKIAIITDEKVNSLYGAKVESNLKDFGYTVVKYVVKGGEESKSGAVFLEIAEFLAQNEFTRSDCLLALGGGVVGDLTGFVAATFLRGLKFVQVPTTLLAFADSSVGGKTAINLNSGKNLVGAFYQPEVVICDTDCAKTLDKEDYACGMAEIIKYGMIFDKELLDLLMQGMEDNSEEIIARCVDWKRTVVERDEHDHGDRQLLNFGHTLGHAVEKQSHYEIMHGQAVAIGMKMITATAVKKGVCDKECEKTLDKLLKKYGLYNECKYSVNELISTTMVDKKRKGNTITVVLPTALGRCELKKMNMQEWRKFILD